MPQNKPTARSLTAGLPLKVFIVGAPRSGTSILLRAMKDALGLPGYGESHVMPVFQQIMKTARVELGKFSKKQQKILVKEIQIDALDQHLRDFLRKFYMETFPEGRWVDKTPSGMAVAGLPLIESTFPDARLIMIRRNGIEVVISHMKKFQNSSFNVACLGWTKAMNGLLKARESCHNLLEVDQYDLQNNSDQVSRSIANHLGIPQHADVLAAFFLNERVQGSSTHDPKKRLRLEETGWSAPDAEIFRQTCGPTMEKFGYEM